MFFWKRDKKLPEMVTELKQLTIDYAKQETIQPLKNLGRYLLFGSLGSIVLGLGLTLWVTAGLRALQEETGSTFTGHLSWAPYGITIVGTVLVMGLAALAIGKERRAAERRRLRRLEANGKA